MKHNLKITFILLGMFLITQFLGLYVVNYYSPVKIVSGDVVNVSSPSLPYGMQPPAPEQEKDFYSILPSIVISFIIAILFFFLLIKFKVNFVMRFWFFSVVTIALGISMNALIPKFTSSGVIIFAVALTLAFEKVYRKNIPIHNLTELFIYPGIAAVFVPILNIYTLLVLLVLISAYDIWAVWHSGIMQKMAKYQINSLNIFSGFLIPYMSKKLKAQIEKIKLAKGKIKEKLEKKKIKVNVALLGGGDVVFPIISSGVALKTFGLATSICVILGAALGLSYLFFFAEKKKFYPAMPYITTGIFLGMLAGWAIRSI